MVFKFMFLELKVVIYNYFGILHRFDNLKELTVFVNNEIEINQNNDLG